MFEKIKKLLFTTKEEKTKAVISTEMMEKTLKKIRDENECKLKELMENMPKLNLNLIAECNITPTALMIEKDNATVNKFFEDVEKSNTLKALERRMISYNLECKNELRLVDLYRSSFGCELYKAASCRNVSDIHKVELLLKNGANPNERSSSGNTPLHKAIVIENLPAIKLLLVYGANLFIKNKEGRTPYDLFQGKTLIEDLISNDKEISAKFRVQVLNHNLNKLDKKGLSRWLGDFDAYKVIEGKNDIAIKKGQPVSSLKELCTQKILGYIEII